jgi:NADH-quinone oxidoreductase subunit E
MILSTKLELTQDQEFQCIDLILEKHQYQSTKLIPILQAVQEEYRYLPEDVLYYVADALDMPAAKLFGMATFYSHFAMEPRGKIYRPAL